MCVSNAHPHPQEEIAKDLLSGDYEEEAQSSADDLTPSVTSHEATDFFPRTLRCKYTANGPITVHSPTSQPGICSDPGTSFSVSMTWCLADALIQRNLVLNRSAFISLIWTIHVCWLLTEILSQTSVFRCNVTEVPVRASRELWCRCWIRTDFIRIATEWLPHLEQMLLCSHCVLLPWFQPALFTTGTRSLKGKRMGWARKIPERRVSLCCGPARTLRHGETGPDRVSLFFSRQEIMVGSQYQAEVPTSLCHYGDNEKGEFCGRLSFRATFFLAVTSCMAVECLCGCVAFLRCPVWQWC